MDRAVAAVELMRETRDRAGDAIRFVVAKAAHDAAIRRLLRETPMAGNISVSMEHEPSHFAAAAIAGAEHQTILALKDDRVICMGSISRRMRFINGVPTRVGYLSDLRLDSSCHGQASILRRGYQLLRELHEKDGPMIYLTSIIADNLPARRFFERGLRGMPTYRFLGEFVTLVIARRGRCDSGRTTADLRSRFRAKSLKLIDGSPELIPQIVELLNERGQAYQFAPVWSGEDLYAPGLSPENFRLLCDGDEKIVACAALWNQRSVKQTVVRGYSNGYRRWRPLINIGAAMSGKPRLPQVGQPIPFAFASHLACDSGHRDLIEPLVRVLQRSLSATALDYLTIGFDARDPRLQQLQAAFAHREYRSRLYAVHWKDGAELAQSLDDRLLAPEAALL